VKKYFYLVATAVFLFSSALAQDVMPAEDSFEAPKKEYSPFVDDYFPTRPL
jgi:hypothetical protein